jgi:autotransporter-associated beta strand protein
MAILALASPASLPAAPLLTAALPDQPFASSWSLATSAGLNSFLNWNPAADPNAAFNVSNVPLATRFTPAQVNGRVANTAAQLMAVGEFNGVQDSSADSYDTAGDDPSQSFGSMATYLPTYWQYTDQMVYWGGSGHDGTIRVPNATIIDAAHRNGTTITGTVFLGGNSTELSNLLETPDGGKTYPVAAQLAKVAAYDHFDGWFINPETATNTSGASALQGFMAYFHTEAAALGYPNLQVQWYNAMTSNGSLSYPPLNSSSQMFFESGGSTVANSVFTDYRDTTSSNITTSVNTANSLGRSPYSVFAGLEIEQWYNGNSNNGGYTSPYANSSYWNTFNTTSGSVNTLKTSAAFFRTDWSFKYTGTATQSTDLAKLQYEMANDGNIYVGGSGDPSNTGTPVSGTTYYGVANYIQARAPAPVSNAFVSNTFLSNFNIGAGSFYNIGGQQLATGEWNDMSLQDIMPTWRWLIRSSDGGGTTLAPNFDFTRAWYGGTSLSVTGNMTAYNNLSLYATQLSVSANSNFKIAFEDGQAGAASMLQVALTFSDSSVGYLSCGTATSAGWNTSTFNLATYAGKTITGIGLRFGNGSAVSNYTMNVGELLFYNGPQSTPAAATNMQTLASGAVNYITAAMQLAWTHATGAVDANGNPTGAVYAYNVYQLNPNNSQTFLGATPDNAYYVPSITRSGTGNFATIEVQTVAADMGVSQYLTETTYVDWARPAWTLTWQGNGASPGGSGTWNATSLTWHHENDPAATVNQYWSNAWGDTAVFSGSAGNVAVSSTLSVGSLSFNTAGYTLSGTSAMTLVNGGVTVSGGTAGTTIGVPLVISGNQTWLNSSGGTLAATAAVTFSPGGLLALTGSGTYYVPGLTNASGIIAPWVTFGSGSSTRYAVQNGASVGAFIGTATSDATKLTSAATNYELSTTGTTALTGNATAFTARYSGSGYTVDLGASGGNTLTLNGLMNVGGPLVVERSGGTGSVVIGTTQQLIVSGPGNITITAPIGDSTSGSASLTQGGAGTLTLSGSNTYSGGTYLNAGTLVVVNDSQLGTPPASAATNLSFNGGALAFSGTGSPALNANRSIAVNASSGTINVLAAGNFVSYAGQIAGPGGLTKGGPGTLVLSGVSTYLGGTVVNQGTLALANANALGGGPLLLQNGTLSLVQNGVLGFGSMQVNGVAAVANNVLTVTNNVSDEAGSAFTSMAVPISNSAGFTASFVYTAGGSKAADGFTFCIQNDGRGATALGGYGGGLGYGPDNSGAPILNSGSVQFNIFSGSTTGLGTSGSDNKSQYNTNSGTSAVNVASGDPILVAVSYSGTAQTVTETLTDQTTRNTVSYSYTGVNFQSLLGSQSGYVGFTGGDGGSTSTQTISNFVFNDSALAVQYATPITVAAGAAGQLSLGTTSSTSAMVGPLTLSPGASLIIARSGATNSNAPYQITAGSLAVIGPASINVAQNGSGLGTLSVGALSGSGNLAVNGPGKLGLSGAGSAFTGNVTIYGGVIELDNATALINSAVTVSAGTGLTFGSGITAATIGGLAGSGSITLQTTDSLPLAVALTVAGSQSTTYSGALNGAGSLTKAGAGTLLLTGNNNNSGPTAVNQGVLMVNGPLASPVTVNGGGVLAGTGSLSSVVVNSGGTLSPGDAPGALQVSGSVSMMPGAIMDFTLDAASTARTSVKSTLHHWPALARARIRLSRPVRSLVNWDRT